MVHYGLHPLLICLLLSAATFAPSDGYGKVAAKKSAALDTSREVDRWFYFVDKYSPQVGPGIAARYPLKPWLPSERAVLRQKLAEVLQQSPWLVTRAGAGRQIRLYRTPAVEAAYGAAPAASFISGLMIGDDFFSFSEALKIEAVEHELVHCADGGRQYSLSKDWINFCSEKISDIRLRAAVLGEDFNFNSAKEGWPSLYAASNLSEAFAVYTVECMHKREAECPPVVSQLLSKKDPPPEQQEFLRHFVEGLSQYVDSRNDSAIEQFTKCISLDETAGPAHAFLAYCYKNKNAIESALSQSKQAKTHFDADSVPTTDPLYVFNETQVAQCEYLIGSFPGAIASLNFLLSSAPRNAWALLLRGQCFEVLGRFGDAANDYGLSKASWKRPVDDVLASGATPKMVLTLYDQLLTKGTNPTRTLGRAQYLTFLGDHEIDTEKRKDFYRRAIADFSACAHSPEIDQQQAVFGEADAYGKLGDTESARTKADSLTKDSIAWLIMQVRLLELDGKEQEAKEMLHRLYQPES
jgi:tetratricopeptide (TPR) repeat protein